MAISVLVEEKGMAMMKLKWMMVMPGVARLPRVCFLEARLMALGFSQVL